MTKNISTIGHDYHIHCGKPGATLCTNRPIKFCGKSTAVGMTSSGDCLGLLGVGLLLLVREIKGDTIMAASYLSLSLRLSMVLPLRSPTYRALREEDRLH